MNTVPYTLPTASLRVLKGPNPGKEIRISPVGITLGRNPQSGVHLDQSSVSRTHARIFWQGECYYIEDLKSRNGVQVNGRRSARFPLRNADVITICGYEFLFEQHATDDSVVQPETDETVG